MRIVICYIVVSKGRYYMKWHIAPKEKLVADITERIAAELRAARPVTFFVSGGSALDIESAIIRQLDRVLDTTSQFTVLPVDERYGGQGHNASNIAALQKLLKGTPATVIDILENDSLESARSRFEHLFTTLTKSPAVSYAILGIGEDGHTAGILPGSVAATSPLLVEAYISDPYTRLTLTEQAIVHLDHVYISAYGSAKHSILETLASETPSGKPMDLLKRIPDVTIYTDNTITKGV